MHGRRAVPGGAVDGAATPASLSRGARSSAKPVIMRIGTMWSREVLRGAPGRRAQGEREGRSGGTGRREPPTRVCPTALPGDADGAEAVNSCRGDGPAQELTRAKARGALPVTCARTGPTPETLDGDRDLDAPEPVLPAGRGGEGALTWRSRTPLGYIEDADRGASQCARSWHRTGGDFPRSIQAGAMDAARLYR